MSVNRKNPNIKTYIGTKPAEGACDNVCSMSAGSMSNVNDNVEMSSETTSANKSGFRMMALNIFSLMPHLDELRIFVTEKKPHIIGITETKIDSSNLGDTNCDMFDFADNDTKHLIKLLTKYNLTQMIKSPTRTTATTKTIIDHIITNRPESVSKNGKLEWCSGQWHQ